MPATIHPALPARATAGPPVRADAGTGPRLMGVTDVAGPALVVAFALGLLVAAGLFTFHGNATGFVRFGHNFVSVIRPPHAALIFSDAGYDGQYFWSLAQDPLILHHQTLVAFAAQSFRLQRIAYPALAFLLAGGQPRLTPWTLLGVNVVVVLAATIAFALYARRRGWSGWWALAIGLLPGFGFAVLADLSDVLAVTAMLAGVIAWRDGRRLVAAGSLSVAVLAREPMMLAVVAIALEAVLDARGPRIAGRLRDAWRTAWPVAIPAVAFAAWQVYIAARIARSTSAPGTAFSPPFGAIATEVGHALHNASAVDGAWDLVYLGLMLGGVAVAAAMTRRHRTAATIAALLFGLMLLVLTFGYAWSYTRLSAPMFACLLLAGLEGRHRGALRICALVASLGALVPLAIG